MISKGIVVTQPRSRSVTGRRHHDGTPSTFCRVRYRELTATCPTVGGIATPTYTVDSWTKKPRNRQQPLWYEGRGLAAAAK